MGPFQVILYGMALATLPEAIRILKRSPRHMMLFCVLCSVGLTLVALAWGVTLLVALPRGLGQWLLGPIWRPTYELVLPMTLLHDGRMRQCRRSDLHACPRGGAPERACRDLHVDLLSRRLPRGRRRGRSRRGRAAVPPLPPSRIARLLVAAPRRRCGRRMAYPFPRRPLASDAQSSLRLPAPARCRRVDVAPRRQIVDVAATSASRGTARNGATTARRKCPSSRRGVADRCLWLRLTTADTSPEKHLLCLAVVLRLTHRTDVREPGGHDTGRCASTGRSSDASPGHRGPERSISAQGTVLQLTDKRPVSAVSAATLRASV